jgi:hypothetical protein
MVNPANIKLKKLPAKTIFLNFILASVEGLRKTDSDYFTLHNVP